MGLLFGKAFCIARVQRNLLQVEAARRVGMDQSYLAAIEKGRRKTPSYPLFQGLMVAIQPTAAEERRLAHFAAVDGLIESLDEDVPAEHPSNALRGILNQMANLGDVEMRCVATLVDSLAQERAKRMEDYL